ncbi:MAG: sugar ABC transporter permease, partial [Clostridia bacterium]|nr:sugar ABC transporter permease [Clostridia bacterium]
MDFLLYVMLLPGIIYFVVFKYAPMYGIIIGFSDYNIVSGFSDMPWVGFGIFEDLFTKAAFQRAFINNIKISFLKILWGFPMPIILSILINEVKNLFYKKFVQTTVILPHFISWFVIYGMLYALCNLSTGAIPEILKSINAAFGTDIEVVNYLAQKETFMTVLILSYLWQSSGYGTIVYLAAITGIDQQL